MLVIELDGITHLQEDVGIKDIRKQTDLENAGFTVMRFNDEEVLNRIAVVSAQIEGWIEERESSTKNGDSSINK